MPITPAARERLAEAIEDRRLELALRLQDVAEAAGISLKTLHSVRTGDKGIAPLTQIGLAKALRWTPDSVQRILDGLDPEPLLASVAPHDNRPSAVDADELAAAILAAADAVARMNGRPATPQDLFPGDGVEQQWERLVWADEGLPAALRAETVAKARLARMPAQEENDRSALACA